jgi:hypothetical protein
MRIDEMDFDQKLSILKKFLAERENKTNKENEKDDELDKKIIDDDKFEKPDKPKEKPKEEPQQQATQEIEELNEINTIFQLVIQIDRVKLEYIKPIDKFKEMVSDSHIVILKNNDKYIFPSIEYSMIKYEMEHIREWKNNKEKLSLDKKKLPADMLFKKAMINDIKEILDKLFKFDTYKIDSIRIGKEYLENNFLVYVEISNPVEKSKSVKFKSGKSSFGGVRLKPYGVKIKDMIDMAVKYSVSIKKSEDEVNNKNPFSAVVMLYLAEVTFQEDMKGLL